MKKMKYVFKTIFKNSFIIIPLILYLMSLCLLAVNSSKLNKANKEINELTSSIQAYQSELCTKNTLLYEANDEVEIQTEMNKDLIERNAQMQELIDEIFNIDYQLVYLGEFTITYYCAENYPHICNDGDSTVTASGSDATVGRTIAVDTSVIPFNTEVYIDGIGVRVAEDRGGAINDNHIDVLVATHKEALEKGKETKSVWMLVKVS